MAPRGWPHVPVCDADLADAVTVVGVLRVVDHPPDVIGGVLVEAWTEVRVERGRLAAP